jgi:DNA-binding transcriptional ArsR family regulator
MYFKHMTTLTPKQLDDVIKALAHPVRRDILHWLKTPEQYFADQEHPLSLGVCAGKIERQTGLSQSTVSAHLATLQRAGVIGSQKVGQWHFFKRNDELIGQFLSQISHEL